MIEQEELADELSSADKMSAADRLKTARKKRYVQLKKYQQYERQLDKENQKKSASASGGRKKTATSTKPVQPQRASPRVQFVSNVVLLEAAARNDIEEGRLLSSGLFVFMQSVSSPITSEGRRRRKPEGGGVRYGQGYIASSLE